MSGIKGMIIPAAIGAGGAVLMDIAYGYISPMLPTSITGSPYVNAAIKAAGAIGLGMVAGKVVGSEKGRLIAMGALTVIGAQLLQSLVAQMAPTLPFAGLSGIGAYMPMGAYIPGSGMGRLGAYNPAPYLLPGNSMGPGMPLAGTADFGPGVSDSMF